MPKGAIGAAVKAIAHDVAKSMEDAATATRKLAEKGADSIEKNVEDHRVNDEGVRDRLHAAANGSPADGAMLQTGGELRRVRGDIDFEEGWAEQAYDTFRAGNDELPGVIATASRYGFGADDVTQIKNHVFRDEHLLDLYGDSTVARFDANPRMAEAWQRLAAGDPHPADIDLLEHERYESNFMARTGDPSYGRAHAATNDAGYTWDPEAAARDGFGYQRRD
jgi:hypothetical protein